MIPENFLAFSIFQKIKAQHIMSPMAGPIDLNLGVLISVLEMYAEREKLSLGDKIDVFELVHFGYRVYLKETYPDQFQPQVEAEDDPELED